MFEGITEIADIEAEILKPVKITIPADAVRRIVESNRRGVCTSCLDPFRPNERRIRGCHQKCYRKIARSIRSEKEPEATEEWYVTRGVLLPPAPVGAKQTERFREME